MMADLGRKILPQRIKKGINFRLRTLGYLYKKDMLPIDFREHAICPLEALKRANHYPVLVNIPTQYCRGFGLMAFSCAINANHPLVRTLLEVMSGKARLYQESSLSNYYQMYQPLSGEDILGLAMSEEANFSQPALWFIEPWLACPSQKEETKKIKAMQQENKRFGITPPSKKEWLFFGPLSKERGELEFHRLTSLAKSITMNGYERSNDPDGDITGALLVRDHEYRVAIISGQHRVCALAASGHAYIPVRINVDKRAIVRRENANEWLSVKKKIYTLGQAQSIFDRVFEGKQPPGFIETPFEPLKALPSLQSISWP